MRAFISAFFALALLCTYTASAQTETVETTTTVDSATGKKTTTYSTSVSRSEDITSRSNMILIAPIKFFMWYNLSYYRALSRNIVVGGGVQLPTGWMSLVSDNINTSGFGVNVEMRYHPSGKALRGFYIAPIFSTNFLSAEITNNNGDKVDGGTATTTSIGALAGWQFFIGDEFALDFGIGIDKHFLSLSDDSDTENFAGLDGVFPSLRFNIGYAW